MLGYVEKPTGDLFTGQKKRPGGGVVLRVGCPVGEEVKEGREVGVIVGTAVGVEVGWAVGVAVGVEVGLAVGVAVGL